MEALIVIDMQKDFIDGALGTPEAASILPAVKKKIAEFNGLILATRDTHGQDYLKTQEGQLLPVVHCIRGTEGWQLHPDVEAGISRPIFDKPSFGSQELALYLSALHRATPLKRITLIGLCTDICVISNALILKAFLPEVPVCVDASCCAGVTPEGHERALLAMQSCQVEILH